MASRVPDDFESGVGDITEILSNQGVSDLSWLNVDPDEYRELEALPKQNLDSIPELTSALSWDGRDDRVQSVTPLRPHSPVNQNPLDRPEATLRTNSSVPDRLASYVLAGMSDADIVRRMRLEFSPEQLSASHVEASKILGERGLLGNVYVDSAHFPRCAQEGKHRELVSKKAKLAMYVLAKEACGGCVCNKGGSCSSFQKRLTAEVPYDLQTAAHYMPMLAHENRLSGDTVRSVVASGKPGDIKAALREAFLRPASPTPVEVPRTIQKNSLPKSVPVTAADVAAYEARRAAAADVDPMPGSMYLVAARRMMSSKCDVSSLVVSSDPEVRSLASEHGLLGRTYVDGDALGGLRATYSFLRSRPAPDFVLLRSLSASDVPTPEYVELSKLAPVMRRRPVLSMDHFRSALDRAVTEGRVTPDHASAIASRVEATPFPDGGWDAAIAHLNLASAPSEDMVAEVQTAGAVTLHHGSSRGEAPAAQMDPEEVRRSISHLMNTGLSGRSLQAAVLRRYSRADLSQVPSVGASLSKDDGVQGSYFIDPTAYRDYGRGCNQASDSFRLNNRVPHVLASSGCTGCRLQTHPGWCSKLAKTIIRQVPDEVRTEVAERRTLPVVQAPSPSGDPVSEFGLAAELSVDIAPKRRSGPEISISGHSVSD